MNLDNYKNFVKLSFGLEEINYNDMLTKQFSSIEPNIQFNKEKGKLYTIITIDPDAPSPNNPEYKYFLHMLKVNDSDTIMKWTGPNPPKKSGTHRYYTCVFEQPNKIDVFNNKIDTRPNFNLNLFVKSNNLIIKGCTKFTVKG